MESKSFLKSKTFWSLAVTVIGVLAPKYAGVLQESTGDIIAVVGIVAAFIARLKADKPLHVSAPSDPRNTGPLGVLLAFALLASPVLAQDKTKASEKPIDTKVSKEAPAEVTLSVEAVKPLMEKAQNTRIAQLEVENLQFKIQNAQRELEQLKERAGRLNDESRAAYQRALIKAGVPGDHVEDYEAVQQADGTLKATRKSAPVPLPAK